MRVAVVNETSAVDKHPAIVAALEGRGLQVINAGMAEKGETPELQYIHTGLISALLLAADRVDLVVGGCGTGQGFMNAVMQYPGVSCGHLLTSLDAFLFARINAGNVVSLALNQGWGWAGDENLQLLFDQLFTDARGRGYPAHRQEPQRASRQSLRLISEAAHRPMAEILERLPHDVIFTALTHPAAAAALDVDSISDAPLRAALRARLAVASMA
ncbi:MAG TPA: RpiB/LacA/LacB family sugar-phosphate isomerase [Candidatus Limnocylindrales bacterium]|jgi:ribose 5-phosphate isomerase RpiB|nr:RpiB/LacA/LacB family sugar-phosphate isomerase [Candidatus Limnocylindrales bacterium]